MAHYSPWHHTYAGALALHHFFFSLYYMSGSLANKNMTKLDWLHFTLTGDDRFKDAVSGDAVKITVKEQKKRPCYHYLLIPAGISPQYITGQPRREARKLSGLNCRDVL